MIYTLQQFNHVLKLHRGIRFCNHKCICKIYFLYIMQLNITYVVNIEHRLSINYGLINYEWGSYYLEEILTPR